eukprot:TRINITY_DN65167_c0_g1_i1.p1 TRINITY_DN65167_c0_g1~~TRINITY_DN65167_c0_g1_i1.p1  ORF type:complete len:1123 (+),score=227.32 TRINITY_DN65167_c0_g1_i1:64-3432(+)
MAGLKRPRWYAGTVCMRFLLWGFAFNGAFLCRYDAPTDSDGCAVGSRANELPHGVFWAWGVLANFVNLMVFCLSVRNILVGEQTKVSNKVTGVAHPLTSVGLGLTLAFLGPLWGTLSWLAVAGNGWLLMLSHFPPGVMPALHFRFNFLIRIMHQWDVATDVGMAALLDSTTPEGIMYLVLATVNTAFYFISHTCPLDSSDSRRRIFGHLVKGFFMDLPLLIIDVLILARGTDASGTAVTVLAALSSLGELGTVVHLAVAFHSQMTSERHMHAVVELAERVAGSLVKYDLDEAAAALADFRAEAQKKGKTGAPEALVRAFQNQIDNLALYKAFLPDYVLPESDKGSTEKGASVFTTLPEQSSEWDDQSRLSVVPLQQSSRPSADASAHFTAAEDISISPPLHPHMVSDSRTSSVTSVDVQNDQPGAVVQASQGRHCGRRPGLVSALFARVDLSKRPEPGKACIAAVLDSVRKSSGVIVGITGLCGDATVIAEWNGKRRCTTHAQHACQTALDIVESYGRRRHRSGTEGEFSSDRSPLDSSTNAPAASAAGTALGDPSSSRAQCYLSVATGAATSYEVGNSQTRSYVLLGNAVRDARGLSLLASQLDARALCCGRTNKAVRSEIQTRIIDVVSPRDADEIHVYELIRRVREEQHCFHGAFSDLRQLKFEDAAEVFKDVIVSSGGHDKQALRLFRIAQYYATHRAGEAYVRQEHPYAWEDLEQLAAATPLPRDLEFVVGLSTVDTLANSKSISVKEDADDGVLLQRQLNELVNQVANQQQGTPPSMQSPTSAASSRCATEPRVISRSLPLSFTDARGRRYHRSSTRLGLGAFGEVWLGMGPDCSMVAVKSFSLAGLGGTGEARGPDMTGTWTCMGDTLGGATLGRHSAVSGQGLDVDLDKIKAQTAELVKEVSLMISLKHDNVVQYLGCATEGAYVLIVMEYLPGGSLQGLMKQFGGTIPVECVASLVGDTVRGLQFIHSNNIVHRDLKPANILVTVEGQARIADFGASSQLRAAGVAGDRENVAGTPLYMAPEQAHGRASFASDVWALGLIVCELHIGHLPWTDKLRGMHPLAFAATLCRDEHMVPEPPQSVPTEAAAFARWCTKRDPEQRPTALQLLDHPYLL